MTYRLTALATAFALAVAAPAMAQDDGPVATAAPVVTMAEATTIQADDHIYGSADAPHELVMYASVTCGHCASWFNDEWAEVKALADAGQLRVAVREVPTTPAQISVAGFMIANCAGEDNWFDNIALQFARQEATFAALQEGKGQEVFTEIARDSGLEGDSPAEACLAEDANFVPIDRSMARFEAAKGSGVPMFFFDGDEVKGAHNAADIAALVTESVAE